MKQIKIMKAESGSCHQKKISTKDSKAAKKKTKKSGRRVKQDFLQESKAQRGMRIV
jgi:hypothetical protein